MDLGNDGDSPIQNKKVGTGMSFRQQIRYVLSKSLEEKRINSTPISDDSIRELEDYLQDEDLRVNII